MRNKCSVLCTGQLGDIRAPRTRGPGTQSQVSSLYNHTYDPLIFPKRLPGNNIPSDDDISKKKKLQVGKDQEKAQSEKDSHSKNRGGKKLN